MKRRWLLLGAAVFAVIEALAILYAVWPALTKREIVLRPEIRLGVIAAPPLESAQEEWLSFASSFSEKHGCLMRVYFASSEEEAAAGLLNGSLDILYSDTACFLELNGKAKLKIWLYHRLSKRERERMRSVLVCSKPISYISESKGMRLTFSGSGSMTGRTVPSRHLEEKLPCKTQEWFSSVDSAGSEEEAVDALLNDKSDIVACSDISLESLMDKAGAKAQSLKRIWISMPLPENVLCSMESLGGKAAEKLAEASEEIKSSKLKEEFLTARSMVFLPPDHSFIELRNALQRFLEGPRAAKSKTPVSKESN